MGETEEDGAKPLRQPKKDGSQKPIRQAENEIPVFALFAILANMDPRTMSELIAKKIGTNSQLKRKESDEEAPAVRVSRSRHAARIMNSVAICKFVQIFANLYIFRRKLNK